MPKFPEYNSFIHLKSYNIVAKCALCGREIIDPPKCIVYENLLFDRPTCHDIYKKLKFIYEIAVLDILET